MSDQIPAGWYADPLGRFDHRYWDGDAWTSNVSRAGEMVDDPIPGAEPSVVAVDDTAPVAPVAAIVADDSPTETLLPVAAVAASRDVAPRTEPAKSKGLSIPWVWAIAALIGALVLGGAVGAASAGDDTAKNLADERVPVGNSFVAAERQPSGRGRGVRALSSASTRSWWPCRGWFRLRRGTR